MSIKKLLVVAILLKRDYEYDKKFWKEGKSYDIFIFSPLQISFRITGYFFDQKRQLIRLKSLCKDFSYHYYSQCRKSHDFKSYRFQNRQKNSVFSSVTDDLWNRVHIFRINEQQYQKPSAKLTKMCIDTDAGLGINILENN